MGHSVLLAVWPGLAGAGGAQVVADSVGHSRAGAALVVGVAVVLRCVFVHVPGYVLCLGRRGAGLVEDLLCDVVQGAVPGGEGDAPVPPGVQDGWVPLRGNTC